MSLSKKQIRNQSKLEKKLENKQLMLDAKKKSKKTSIFIPTDSACN
jgi:hypothetical protein